MLIITNHSIFVDKQYLFISLILSRSNAEKAEDSKQFTFDRAYDDKSTQIQVFQDTAQSIIDSVFEGFNGILLGFYNCFLCLTVFYAI